MPRSPTFPTTTAISPELHPTNVFICDCYIVALSMAQQLSDKGADVLYRDPSKFTHLKYINLNDNCLSETAVEPLEERLPQIDARGRQKGSRYVSDSMSE